MNPLDLQKKLDPASNGHTFRNACTQKDPIDGKLSSVEIVNSDGVSEEKEHNTTYGDTRSARVFCTSTVRALIPVAVLCTRMLSHTVYEYCCAA